MADIITRNQKGGRKIHSTKVDLTPMVDLGFLLITFFVFTTTLSSTQALHLIMPKDDQKHRTDIPESGAVTIIPDENGIWYYEGNMPTDKSKMVSMTYNNINELRNKLLTLSQRLIRAHGNNDKMMVMIKPTPAASFSQVVDMLDEMKICAVKRYALLDIEQKEYAMLK